MVQMQCAAGGDGWIAQPTYRLGGLQRSGGEGVPAAAALGAEVRRR